MYMCSLGRLADFEECYDYSDVIYHALLALPSLGGLANQKVYSAIGVPVFIVTVHDRHHDLVI